MITIAKKKKPKKKKLKLESGWEIANFKIIKGKRYRYHGYSWTKKHRDVRKKAYGKDWSVRTFKEELISGKRIYTIYARKK